MWLALAGGYTLSFSRRPPAHAAATVAPAGARS